MTLLEAIRSVYTQVRAPTWASSNLDALSDVLRDLSWLPAGPVRVQLSGDEAVDAVVRRSVEETADGPRPIRVLACD